VTHDLARCGADLCLLRYHPTILPRPSPLVLSQARHWAAAGPVLGPPPVHLKARSRSTNEHAVCTGSGHSRSLRRAAHRLPSVRVEDTLVNPSGSRFRPSGHGPDTALAPRWLIASALAEGRAWLNRRAHLGAIRPSPLSCGYPTSSLTSFPHLSHSATSVAPAGAPTATFTRAMQPQLESAVVGHECGKHLDHERPEVDPLAGGGRCCMRSARQADPRARPASFIDDSESIGVSFAGASCRRAIAGSPGDSLARSCRQPEP